MASNTDQSNTLIPSSASFQATAQPDVGTPAVKKRPGRKRQRSPSAKDSHGKKNRRSNVRRDPNTGNTGTRWLQSAALKLERRSGAHLNEFKTPTTCNSVTHALPVDQQHRMGHPVLIQHPIAQDSCPRGRAYVWQAYSPYKLTPPMWDEGLERRKRPSEFGLPSPDYTPPPQTFEPSDINWYPTATVKPQKCDFRFDDPVRPRLYNARTELVRAALPSTKWNASSIPFAEELGQNTSLFAPETSQSAYAYQDGNNADRANDAQLDANYGVYTCVSDDGQDLVVSPPQIMTDGLQDVGFGDSYVPETNTYMTPAFQHFGVSKASTVPSHQALSTHDEQQYNHGLPDVNELHTSTGNIYSSLFHSESCIQAPYSSALGFLDGERLVESPLDEDFILFDNKESGMVHPTEPGNTDIVQQHYEARYQAHIEQEQLFVLERTPDDLYVATDTKYTNVPILTGEGLVGSPDDTIATINIQGYPYTFDRDDYYEEEKSFENVPIMLGEGDHRLVGSPHDTISTLDLQGCPSPSDRDGIYDAEEIVYTGHHTVSNTDAYDDTSLWNCNGLQVTENNGALEDTWIEDLRECRGSQD
ncbi:MAG: hypothetical protein Q9222_006308 [Ikaeria aurantiellina]